MGAPTRPAVRSYANLAAMPLTWPNGSIAWSQADGNFAIMTGGAWGLVPAGVVTAGTVDAVLVYANLAAMPAIANGSVLYSQADGRWALRTGGVWALIPGYFPAPGADQAITLATDTIVPTAELHRISGNTPGGVTLTSTPQITLAADGTKLVLRNTGADFVKVQREAALGGAALKLGAASRQLDTGGQLVLVCDAAFWWEVSFSQGLT